MELLQRRGQQDDGDDTILTHALYTLTPQVSIQMDLRIFQPVANGWELRFEVFPPVFGLEGRPALRPVLPSLSQRTKGRLDLFLANRSRVKSGKRCEDRA